jgi:RNA-binding protein 25
MDEETKKKDQIVKGAIDALIQENASELNAPSTDDESNRRKRKREKKEEVMFYYRIRTNDFISSKKNKTE